MEDKKSEDTKITLREASITTNDKLWYIEMVLSD